jgi:hypothetical protein
VAPLETSAKHQTSGKEDNTAFQIKKSTKMSRFAASAHQRSVNMSPLHFMIDEKCINEDDIAKMLELEDDSLILCCDRNHDKSYITILVRDLTEESACYKFKRPPRCPGSFAHMQNVKKSMFPLSTFAMFMMKTG